MAPRGEFETIAQVFRPLAAGHPGTFDLGNDGALLDLPPDRSLVLTLDTMVEGVHYLSEDPPDLVARKLLRVNLSDLAAMGARPLAYLLSTALSPSRSESWLDAFGRGLAEDQARYGLYLLGGDTTRTPGPTTLSLCALGSVPRGRTLTRSGARPGDLLFLSGTLGDGALGLLALERRLPAVATELWRYLEQRYRLPEPRLALGEALIGLATAALDVSDGLVADLGHLCHGGGLGAEVQTARLPLSSAGEAVLSKAPELLERVLTGGDDYELLFTAPAEAEGELQRLSTELQLAVTRIGQITGTGPIQVLDRQQRPLALERGGWRHF